MKKLLSFALSILTLMILYGCGSKLSSDSIQISTDDKTNTDVVSTSEDATTSSKTLVVYFSRTGENYQVGYVEKGNTAVVADIIADEMSADEFEIVPVNAYPTDYDEMLTIAKQEASENALPEYKGEVENWDSYDTVFIGYPIWHGDMPRIVYTFLGNHDWTGKTVIPFDTHGGSGLANTKNSIKEVTKTTVLDGLAVLGEDAQKSSDSVRHDVQSWLKGLGF